MNQALDTPDLKIYGPAGSYLEQTLTSSKITDFQRLWERLNKYSDSKYYNLDLELQQRYLQKENVASIMTHKEANDLLYLTNNQEELLYTAKEKILTYHSRMIMSKAFPCPELFNYHIKKLDEAGR